VQLRKILEKAKTPSHGLGSTMVEVEESAVTVQGAASPAVRIGCGINEWTFAVPHPDGFAFAGRDVEPPAAYWSVQARDLHRAVLDVRHAVDEVSTRYQLDGALVEWDAGAGTLRLVATDGRQLATSTLWAVPEGEPALPPTEHVIVPSKGLDALLALALWAGDEPVRIGFPTPSLMWAAMTGRTAWCVLAEGRFPRWADVVPDGPAALTLPIGDPAEIVRAFQLAACVTSVDHQGVHFEAVPADARGLIWTRTPDVGSCDVEVPVVAATGGPTHATLNPTYLIPALRRLSAARPGSLALHGPGSAMVVSAESFTGAVMAMTEEIDHRPRLDAVAKACPAPAGV
jgi:DNA polymerase III sliding clamp (beta) subunit (PCNA family)